MTEKNEEKGSDHVATMHFFDLPHELQEMIMWYYCAISNGEKLDFRTVRRIFCPPIHFVLDMQVRKLRLTCRRMYALLNDERRWNSLARKHYRNVRYNSSSLAQCSFSYCSLTCYECVLSPTTYAFRLPCCWAR